MCYYQSYLNSTLHRQNYAKCLRHHLNLTSLHLGKADGRGAAEEAQTVAGAGGAIENGFAAINLSFHAANEVQ